jgi:ppGpp synthetase/RelA/SpoT-type nucleotidyltranferase
VAHFVAHRHLLNKFLAQVLSSLTETHDLVSIAHSIRHRIKDPRRLKDKLRRKLRDAHEEGVPFDITKDNLFIKVNDLVGVRILHLNTRQIEKIDKVLKAIFLEQQLALQEGPFARTWDDESRTFFAKIGIATQESLTMYTSVHYVVSSKSQTTLTCEIQVRTLMEEVWGEVDHTVNYPHPSKSLACREQILALARATSSATRLVDSIFASVADFERETKKRNYARARKRNSSA